MQRKEEKKSIHILYKSCSFHFLFNFILLLFIFRLVFNIEFMFLFFPDMITLAMGNQAERFIPAFLFLVANDQKKVLGSARALTISHVLVDVFFSCTLRYPCFRT